MSNIIKVNFFENFLRNSYIIKNNYLNKCILVKVLDIKGIYLVVDSNLKSLSYINKQEFLSENIFIHSLIGNFIKVLLIKFDNGRGFPILSREKYFSRIFWKYIKKVARLNLKVVGLFVEKSKGGFLVMMSKIKCFLPLSEVDKRILLNYNYSRGKKLYFNVISFNYIKKNVVLSRKSLYSEYYNKGKIKLINNLKVGWIVTGIVKSFCSYGVYVDLGFLDAIVLSKNITWGQKKYSNETLEINKSVKVRILKIDKYKKRIYAGIKQVKPNPWKNIFEKYKVSYLKYGRVFRITNENIYLIFELGVYGFIKKIKIIKGENDGDDYIDKIKINDYLKVIISYINFKKRFIGFVIYKKKIKKLNKNIVNKNEIIKIKLNKKKNNKTKINKIKSNKLINKNIFIKKINIDKIKFLNKKILKIIIFKKPSLAQ